MAPASHFSCASFSTADLPVAHQYDAYRAFVSPSFDVTAATAASDGYRIDRKAIRLGGLMLVSCERDAFESTRAAGHIRRDQSDAFMVYCNLAGSTILERDDEACDVRPGSLAIRDLSRPMRMRTDGDNVIMLSVPRDKMTAMVGDTDPLHCRLADGVTSRLLVDHLVSLCRQMDGVDAAQAPRLVEVLELMLASALLPTRDTLAEAARPINELLHKRALRYMVCNLMAPWLTPDRIAVEVGVSRRKLYQLFEPDGGVAHQIRRLRLERARAALADPGHIRKVKEVAFAHGFESEAQFCKTFKRQFGLTPSEASTADRAAQTKGET